MESLSNKKLFWVLVAAVTAVGGWIFLDKVLVDKVTANVIKKLSKPYSPSPYGPGVDPDKIETPQVGKMESIPLNMAERARAVADVEKIAQGHVDHETWERYWETMRAR